MICSACGHENRPGRKFCVECGAALALACPACSSRCEAGEKFCGECGAALSAGPARQPLAADRSAATPSPPSRSAADAGARKVVTIVFADLVGSTALHERLDAESARRLMERYYESLRAVVADHDGTVVKLLGDGVMAAFGLDRLAEDDALRAVHAAAAMQRAFRALVQNESGALGAAGLRVAVNTGEVVVSGASDDLIGDPVNVAARLQEQGNDGDVVLGETTRRLVATRVTLAPIGSVTLKGRAEAVAAYRLVSLDPPAGVASTPFVGRESELARLEAVCDAAIAAPATRLAVLLGSPGLGKSRLVDEIARRHSEGATILFAHCNAAGGATFAPIAQAVRGLLGLDDSASGEPVRVAVAAALAAAGVEESEHARLVAGIGGLLTGATASPEETFFVVRRFLARLTDAKPVVLVIDDVHWAEPLLLDLIEHLVQWGSGIPLYILVGARPELRGLRSSLATPGALVADVVTLAGLDAGAAMRHAANVIGASDLPASVAAKVLATSEGNPLFVGELVRMLVQEGALTKEGDRWTTGAGLATVEMPPTIHALLAARIERLRPDERVVLECASIVGRHFSRNAVAALLEGDGSDLDARLEALQRSELIERDTGWLFGEPALRFHHVLIRDAAYRRLLKGTRAELHARLADWIDAKTGHAPEHDETIGWHLEQAHQHLRELGPLDAAAVALGERAALRLSAAGRRALARDDVSLAASLLGRALDRLTAEAPERADLVLDWCEALLSAGDVTPAAAAIDELERVAAGSDRLRAWHTCFAGQLTVLTAPKSLQATVDRVGDAARQLAELDDAAGEAKAHFVHAQALARLGKVGACEAALDQALAAARRAGDRRRANAVLAGAPVAALWGPSPVTRASGRCLDVVRVLRITQGAPAVEAVALSCQGVLEALRGRTDAARRMLASSRALVEELGIAHRLFETDVFIGRIDLLEGDAASAERVLRSGYEGLRDLGLGIDAARAAALLGRALLAQDRATEAEALSHESELLAGDDLQAAIAWRGVRAEALARRGDHAAAIAFAEAAVAIAAATDALLDHADARLALAAALRSAGRGTDADAEERRAIELWETKGATLLVERTRRADVGVEPPDAELQPPSEAATRRSIAPNKATEALVAFNAAMAAPDFAAFRALMSEDYEEIDHPTGVSYGRDANVAALERLMRSRDASCQLELLATLGDALMLSRRRVHARATGGGRFDVGEYEQEAYTVGEVDSRGRVCRHEVFGVDRLGDALVRFYERWAEQLPDGAERTRAVGIARALAAPNGPINPDFFRIVYDPSFQCVDHRVFGTWSAGSAEEMVRHYSLQLDLAPDFAGRYAEILAATADAVVSRMTFFGTGHESGGRFENHITAIFRCGADGRLTHTEVFEADQIAEALACFDAIVAGAQSHPPVPHGVRQQRGVRENAATLSLARFEAVLTARDRDALGEFFDDALHFTHHPTGAIYGRRETLATWRSILNAERVSFRSEILASLGDTLALERHFLSIEGLREDHVAAFGPSELEEITIIEVDDRGRWVRVELFAPDHLSDALLRLHERHAELLPAGPARDRAAATAQAPHVEPFANAATHTLNRVADVTAARDWSGLEDLCATSLCFDDRRPLFLMKLSKEGFLTQHRVLFDVPNARWVMTTIATRGERLSLSRILFHGDVADGGGALEIHHLGVIEVDDHGRMTAIVLFEPADLAVAYAELESRWQAGVGVSHPGVAAYQGAFVRALADRDWDALAGLHAASLVAHDHRLVGWNELRAPESYVAAMRAMIELAPDAVGRLDHLRAAERGLLAEVVWVGTRDGGAFESPFLWVAELDAAGKAQRLDFYDPHHLTAARARFDDLSTSAPRDPFERIVAASPAAAALTRWKAAFDAGDWEGMRSLCAAGMVFEDRRRFMQLSGDAELMIASARERTRVGARPESSFVGTAGDRVAIGRTLWTGGPADGRFEIEYLALAEVDERGRFLAIVFFDADDIRGAQREAWARWAAIDPSVADITVHLGEVIDGWNEKDLQRLRAVFAEGLVVEDRRRTGAGRSEGREEYLRSVTALWELAPESRIDGGWFWLASAPHGGVYELRRRGTLPGGGELVSDDLVVFVSERGLVTRMELFEMDATDVALARFEELDPASLQGQPRRS